MGKTEAKVDFWTGWLIIDDFVNTQYIGQPKYEELFQRMEHRDLQSESGNAFVKQVAGQSEPVSNDRCLGDLNLKANIFSVYAILFTSIHVINVINRFQ